MDESWRMPNHSRRRSTDTAAPNRSRQFGFGCRKPDLLDAEDFADVFGGPPRTVAGRKMPVDFTNCSSFYEEIFRSPETAAPSRRNGRSLRPFSIPATDGEFYGDIFGNCCSGRSRTSSLSVLSSDDLRSRTGEDSYVSSKLRPINTMNTPCRWNSSTMTPAAAGENPNYRRGGAPVSFYSSPSGSENQYMESFAYKSSYQGFSSQNVTSPDITNLEPSSYRGMKMSASDLDLRSSSSGLSSLCQDWEDKGGSRDNFDHGNATMQKQGDDDSDSDSDSDNEVMSSYVIEINSDHYRERNDDAIDEAVAWAKEKYQQHSPKKDADIETEHSMPLEEDRGQDKGATEAKQRSQDDMGLKLLDKEVELWSSGKQGNIRLLLSSLHQILWPNSNWHAIGLTNLIDSSHVKKAYQKAQLCLHPDKMQQRGATPSQKYVAAKVFTILKEDDAMVMVPFGNQRLWEKRRRLHKYRIKIK